MRLTRPIVLVPADTHATRYVVHRQHHVKRRIRYRPVAEWDHELIAAWLGAALFVIVFGLAVAGLFE